uniref:Ubiquitin-like protease family profile domain-containing protein n=1 Tax=Brassica oleracea var. oleracea TaxID=109376 RepID=A0A0D3C0G6_BRAOL
MLGFQLDIKKKYELWSLVGPEPEMLEVHVEAGPSTQKIIAAFERCEGWSRDDRKRLGYLAIFTGYIEERKYPTPTRVSLARLVMELERFGNYPWGRVAFKVLMDSVKGRVISGCYTINGFAQALQASEEAAAEASEEVTTTVGGLTKEDIKTMFKDIADAMREGFGTHYKTPFDKKPRTSRTWWYQILWTSLEWLEDCQWRFNYNDFKDSEPDQNSLGRRLPGGAWNYYTGTIPSFCQSNKVCGTDIDDVYVPVNYNDTHWIAMWISIPKRHIVVWDSICSSISLEELDVVMEPFLYMVPYLLVECASSDEQRAQYSLEPFTYERPTNIPPARAGDCGVYALKYIECHVLGIEFSKKEFAKANGKTMRDKMAVDIFQELPDAHEFENKDNDANLGAYEG